MTMILELILGLMMSLSIALLAYVKRSLSIDGMIAATLLGTVIYAFGSIIVWGVLIAFFISSSALTKLHEKTEMNQSKGRNYIQVLANGSVAAFFSILYYVFQSDVFMIAAVASIASSNADTWASEIGALTTGKTIHIHNFRQASKGVSGAISLLGTLASLLGALFISAVLMTIHALTFPIDMQILIPYGLIVVVCGFLGCLIDSLLGGGLQAKYKGIETGTITENKVLLNEHVIKISGFAWITNDTVNFLSALFASLISLLFFI
jgi:uncharacterized protein (TIGR00297 family)